MIPINTSGITNIPDKREDKIHTYLKPNYFLSLNLENVFHNWKIESSLKDQYYF